MAVSCIGALAVADHHGWVWGYLAVAVVGVRAASDPGEHAPRRCRWRRAGRCVGYGAPGDGDRSVGVADPDRSDRLAGAASRVGDRDRPEDRRQERGVRPVPAAIRHHGRRAAVDRAAAFHALGADVDLAGAVYRYLLAVSLHRAAAARVRDVLPDGRRADPVGGQAARDCREIRPDHDRAIADGFVTTPSSMAGVAVGAVLAVRLRMVWALAIGAVGSALGNWIFVWLVVRSRRAGW